ncbi:TonB-dependent receptor plug domain-containing protein [Novosphingobium rosa]|uniref:TonB-dependent receptor plug domain-containing protein n=1 Tax=Novosphingobium rosa TaxID=76978 RepID=UPI000A604F9B|nr:TonB-dependent receptor [Novosphingobium rosa]
MKVTALLMTGTAAAALLSLPAYAQDTKAPTATADQPAASESADDQRKDAEIIVTGSRIVRNGYASPTPVTVAATEDLAKSTPASLPDALNKLPQFQNSSSPARSSHNFSNQPTNGNILNLRGVGGNRTLILLDGQRVPPTTYLGTVDVDVIPSMLVSRVDVVTAGASAAYGSDAVAGVVNFVLDKNFTGLKGNAQGGVSARGDNNNQRLGLAYGTKLFEGRGHLLLSGEFYNNGGMLRSDRPGGLTNTVYVGSVPGSSASPGSAANPYTIVNNVRLAISNDNGLILNGPGAGMVVDGNGGLRPFNPGTTTGTPAFNVGGDGFAISPTVSAVAPLKTYHAFGRFDYDLAPDTKVFVQGVWSRADLRYSSQSNAFVGTQNAPVFQGNPFIPASIAAQLTPGQEFDVGKYNGNTGSAPITTERTDFWMATIGAEGRFGGWKWNVDYSHGDSHHQVRQYGLYDYQKTYAALDAVRDPATGNTVCATSLSADPAIRSRFAGCQPLNVFLTGDAYTSQAGYRYATSTPMAYDARIRQNSVEASIQGSLFKLPGGTVDIVLGGEYRNQTLDLTSNSDPSLLDTTAERSAYFAGLRGVSSTSLFFWLNNVGVAHGKQNVKEGFAELSVPILKDVPGFRQLSLNAAGRITDYSTSGSAKTWKLGAVWQPVRDILFRGTLSRDIRAPNLFELFAGDQSGIGLLTDPVTNTSQNVSTVTGGNPNLKPEVGNTLALGTVLTPGFLPGFSLSIDYYRLRIRGAIATLNAGQIVNNCYVNSSAPECALISRPTATSFPTSVRVAAANIAFLQTSGIDFDATYNTNIGKGRLTTRLYANWLDKYLTQQSLVAPIYDQAGYGSNSPTGLPHWRGTLSVNYATGPVNVFVSEQYIGGVKVGQPDQPNQNFGGARTPAVWYTDLTISGRIEAMGGTVEPFFTVNNLFDRNPPLVPGTIPGVNLPTIISLYDTVGRAFTAGVRFKF